MAPDLFASAVRLSDITTVDGNRPLFFRRYVRKTKTNDSGVARTEDRFSVIA